LGPVAQSEVAERDVDSLVYPFSALVPTRVRRGQPRLIRRVAIKHSRPSHRPQTTTAFERGGAARSRSNDTSECCGVIGRVDHIARFYHVECARGFVGDRRQEVYRRARSTYNVAQSGRPIGD